MAKKVLLVEYEPRYVERLRALLPPPEFTLTVSHDGEEGLTAFASSHFDVVLLSGMLPRLPSAEVIREIRKKGGATAPPILLLVTGYKGSNPKADAQRVGAFDLLVKPFTDEALSSAVRAALDSADLGAKTMRIPTLQAGASSLTSSDIFSDVLHDLGTEAASPPRAASAARASHETEAEVQRRLDDTLSGILPKRKTPAAHPPAPPSATPPRAAPASRLSTDAEIDRMISDTLSGLPHPPRRPPPAAPPREPSASAPPRPPEPKSAPPVSASGPDRFDQYQLVEKIASGGMAELYKAKRSGVEGFEKIVAIKKILPHLADDDQFITMFADEAKLAAQLNHPNIVHIYDLGKIDSGGYFIAMEYVEGRDLGAILQAGRETGTPLPVPLAIYVASKVASALDYAHRRREADGRELGIVHRDVSPHNILISYEGDIKLCDFGIAKAATQVSRTQSGALKGKVQYMSPEQAWGKPIDRRSDLFSLGVVLSEMLTGEKLFRGDSDLTMLEKVRAAEVVAPSAASPEVPKALDAIVLKALARDPEDRHRTASDLLRDLESVLYSYSPAPGSADLAIYLHRLQAEEAAAAEARKREAARAPAEPERKRRSKGVPLPRRATGSAPAASPAAATPPASEPASPRAAIKKATTGSGVFGTFSLKRMEAEKKGRRPLFLAIGVAALVLIVGIAWFAARKPASGPPLASGDKAPTAPPAAVPTQPAEGAAALQPTPLPAAAVDPRAVEAEVQRQLAARRKELEKVREAIRAAAAKEAAKEVAPAPEESKPIPTAEPPVALAEATPAPTAPPAVVEVVPTRPPPAPAREEQVQPGDLVGPGPGVVEPTLLAPPRVTYPPIARKQRVGGKVVVLVLVSERGEVEEARVQQGIPSKSGVNEAVLQAVRGARFSPPTKNGVPVKMWRTVVVDVKP